MKGIYNEEALNRIAAEDRLDRMIVLVAPGAWISIVGAFIIVGGLLAWGFLGKLPTNVDAEGIYINSGGTGRIYSEIDGFISDVYVKKGDVVKEGDVLATVGSSDDFFALKQIDTRIQYVENITFDSELDVVTQDTEALAQIKLNSKNTDNDVETTRATLELKEEKLADAKKKAEELEAQMLKYKEDFFATLNITDQETQIKYQEASDDYDTLLARYENAKSNYISMAENYNNLLAKFNAQYADFDDSDHTEEEYAVHASAMEEVNAARTQMNDAKELMEDEEKRISAANDKLDVARKAYLEYVNKISGIQADNTIASTEYTEVLQDYATAKSTYKTLLDEVDDMKLKLLLDEGNAENDSDDFRQQFANQKSATLSELNQERDKILNQAEKSEIKASMEGEIYDIPISVGSSVIKGAEVAAILKGNLDDDSIVCFVPVAEAKKLKKGMEAYIYPTTVDKQEYGHIDGKVTKVELAAATDARMQEILGINSLIKEFESKGPVVEVWFSMEEDNTTISGYHWSTDKGTEVDLSTGTMVGTTTITESKRPIDILIPYIKKKLDFEEKK